jgi:F0F1-type ATP synthase assembly protein I
MAKMKPGCISWSEAADEVWAEVAATLGSIVLGLAIGIFVDRVLGIAPIGMLFGIVAGFILMGALLFRIDARHHVCDDGHVHPSRR